MPATAAAVEKLKLSKLKRLALRGTDVGELRLKGLQSLLSA